MKQYEFSARTEDEAVELGLQELGVSIADVDVQVVEEGSKGLFGLFGSRPVKVRLTLKDAEEDPLADLLEDKPAKKPEQKAEKKPEKKPEKKAEPKAEKKPEPKAEPKAEKKPAPEKKKAEKKPEPAEKPAEAKAEKQEVRPMEKPEVTMIPAEELEADSPAGIAHAFLMELTRLMGVDVAIEMGTDAEGNVYGYINGDTLGILIGRRGETLDAVQYLTSLKVNRGKEGYTRVTLDTENYRAKREDTLIRLANRMANRALRTGRKVSLEPMNPYERRIIHYALQQTEGVTTHSEGEEPNRHVVITQQKK
jgi:spoIIIJ-associated protein